MYSRPSEKQKIHNKMASSTDLNIARKHLADVLGDSMKLYLQNLNAWFKKKVNKEEFDFEARKLMRNDTVHLHNEFLLALMAKCQILSSSSVTSKEQVGCGKVQKTGKVKKKPPGGRANLQQRFIQAQTIDYVPQITSKALEEGASPTPLGFVSREGLMPDAAMVHGRMLVCAWETGLADVQDSAVKLLMLSLETQLKYILSLVIQQRKGYKLRENRFVYATGIGVKNPYARNIHCTMDLTTESNATTITGNFQHAPSLRPSIEIGEDIAAEQNALGSEAATDDLEPISMYDLCDTLMLYRNAIVSHSVYAPTIERVIHMKWHPSHEELDQESIHEQELFLKHKLAKRKDFDE
ncbi:transcriptional adapter 1-like [Physella acuta]|uniref:transcriptional adapter 1-like n=1 Tax=Physella acuta TaxID=109671 RepID=UPI0027DD83C5|nr:transcriptional adapter 1-like [Physella acuta]